MRKNLALIVILAVFSTSVHAQTKQELIRTLFNIMQQDSLVDKMFSGVSTSMAGQLASKMKDPGDTALVQEIMGRVMDTSRAITKRMINQDMAAVYDKYFTEKEIRDFISFYRSPSGRQMLQKLPDIQKEVMHIMYEKYLPLLQQTMQEGIKKVMPQTKDQTDQ